MSDQYVGRQVKRLLRDENGSTLDVPIYGVIEQRLQSQSAMVWRVHFCSEDVEKYHLLEYEDLTENEVISSIFS